MLADIEDPPKSRVRGLVIGILVAVPIVAICVGWLVPMFVGAILGGAQDLDERLRAQDSYMQAVCADAFDPDRDEALCGCVFAVEFPALDCQGPFRVWAVERQDPRCADPSTKEAALSYCTCVETIAAAVDAAQDDEAREIAAQPYDRCTDLEDPFVLPAIESLQ